MNARKKLINKVLSVEEQGDVLLIIMHDKAHKN
jgi:hypothetical protein